MNGVDYLEPDSLVEQDELSNDFYYYNKHYIKIREDNAIIDGWSNWLFPEKDVSDAICINNKAGYQFRLVFHEPKTDTYIDMDGNEIQGETRIVETLSEENICLFDFDGIPIYKYVNGEIVKRTKYEIEEDRKKLPPYLPEVKIQKQEENKKALAKFLAEHPIEFKGELYGVDLDSQNEMSLNYMQYQIAKNSGVPTVLQWHSVKSSCKNFEESDFIELSIKISDYIYPYLRQQESIKEEIYNCNTKEEVNNIKIEYK